MKGKLNVLVRMLLECRCGHVHDLTAHFQVERLSTAIKPNDATESQVESIILNSGDCRQREPVFVNSVKLMQEPERVVPTLPSLYLSEKLLRFTPNAMYFSLANGGCILFNTLTNRKERVFVGHSPACFYELPCKMVEEVFGDYGQCLR